MATGGFLQISNKIQKYSALPAGPAEALDPRAPQSAHRDAVALSDLTLRLEAGRVVDEHESLFDARLRVLSRQTENEGGDAVEAGRGDRAGAALLLCHGLPEIG